jgi:glycosyltransferase involved in cell wall biosynthesis
VRVAWLVYGDVSQPTGGYIYDRLVIEGLRGLGDEVEVADPRDASMVVDIDAVVGDMLCARELGRAFGRVPRGTTRVLLVHHLVSWEAGCDDRDGMRAREARVIAASDHVVATSPWTAARLRGAYADPPIDVVVPGADRLPLHPRACRGDGTIELLFVGSIIARKRLPMLLDAIEQLADPRLSLTMVGDVGREREHAQSIAKRVAVSPVLRACVTAVGVVDDDALARRMALADALVLPSSLEGYGIVLTEALRAGLPVLAAREAARAAGICDGGATLVFDDAPGFSEALRRFIRDPSLRAAMKGAARGSLLPNWYETIFAFRKVLMGAVHAATARMLDHGPST